MSLCQLSDLLFLSPFVLPIAPNLLHWAGHIVPPTQVGMFPRPSYVLLSTVIPIIKDPFSIDPVNFVLFMLPQHSLIRPLFQIILAFLDLGLLWDIAVL